MVKPALTLAQGGKTGGFNLFIAGDITKVEHEALCKLREAVNNFACVQQN